jgi:hypothetical protein
MAHITEDDLGTFLSEYMQLALKNEKELKKNYDNDNIVTFQESYKRELYDTIADLRAAIQMIYNNLGPTFNCSSMQCEGCKYEAQEALRIAKNYVPIEKRYGGDTQQPFLDKDFRL